MKRVVFLILIIPLLFSGVALASDAKYLTTIKITNAGTELSNEIAVFTLPTAAMIDEGMLSADASDCAILTGEGGTDLPFMPSANSTYPWVTWVNSVGAAADIQEYLYSKDVTGGKIRYFPDTTGMTVSSDNETLGVSDNFSIEMKGWINTDNGTDKNLVFKDEAFKIFVSPTVSENITARITNVTATSQDLLPNASGNYTGIASATPAVAHYLNVDDPVATPDDAVTTVETSNLTQEKDAYNLSEPSWLGDSQTITSVKVFFRHASTSGSASDKARPFLRLGEDETTGTAVLSPQVPAWLTSNETLARPGGGSWTTADLSTLQVGLGLISAGNPEYCTQVYVHIDYTYETWLSVTAPGVSSGEHTVKVAIINKAESITVYPDANPETTTVDGRVYRHGVDEAWATIIAAAGTGAIDDADSYFLTFIVASTTPNQWQGLQRAIQLYDPSLTPDSANVTSATLTVYGDSKGDSLNITPDINVYAATPTDDTSIIAADFSQVSSTAWCDTPITYANYNVGTPGSPNNFVINSTGLAPIQTALTNNTLVKLGFRNANYDVSGTPPAWISEQVSYVIAWAAEKGAGYRPQLVINYTVPHLAIYIDDMVTPVATTELDGASVPDNANDWIFVENGAMPYMEYTSITIDGDVAGYWKWEYGTTFDDQSVNNNTATPSFRTTSSDTDLTASVIAQEGLVTASTPVGAVIGGWTMIGELPDTPDNLFTEGGDSYGVGDFNIGELITDAAEGAGQDATIWHILIAFGLALLVMFGVYKTTHNYAIGQRGSLILAAFAAEGVLILFYKFTTIPGFSLIPFGIMAVGLLVLRKSHSPVD